ncbi:MAG: porin [Myxococcota bacterium]|nr:porin [Myxococcota bacterium]
MKQRTLRLGARVTPWLATLALLIGTTSSAWADQGTVGEPETARKCTFCDIVKAPGTTLYENEDSWFLNSFKFVGRLQFQTAWIEGSDADDKDFSEGFTDFRRARFGGRVGFGRFFKVKANINLVADLRQVGGNTDWGYQTFDELIGSFDARKAFGWEGVDKLSFHYGRKKMLVGHEVHVSSKRIKTVERSGIANRAFPTRMTGAWLQAAKGRWSGTAGVFTTDVSRDLADWDGGEAYYLNVNHQLANEDNLTFDFLYNDANGDDERNLVLTNQGQVLYEWVLSGAWDGRRGKWGLMANVIVGDNGENLRNDPDREGIFYGFVFLPTYDLTDKLELVGRYAFQGAEEDEGIRTNSRYFRREIKTNADVNGGRGSFHHSLYAGANYYICGDNMKIMTGVEWEHLDTPRRDADAWTLWLAYRMYF